MNVLVIGYGSIGSRHARILKDLGCNVSVVSKRVIDFPVVYPSINDALQKLNFEYVVVANQTSEHYQTMVELVQNNFKGIVLVEKPLFDKKHNLPQHSLKQCYIAYNVRFHPLMQKLKKLLEKEKVIAVQVYVGQYLPTWRPNRDYRSSYSAKKSEGGGVLRDLSHELDYLIWMLDGWKGVVSIGGKYSNLDIDSDDVFVMLLNTERCPVVNVQMNYLDHVARREVIINTENHSIKADLINGFIDIDGNKEKTIIDRDCTYVLQHKAVLSGENTDLCTLEQGYEVLNLIEAIEQSAQIKGWVWNE